MNLATYRAVRAILDADTTLTASQRNAVLCSCQSPEQGGDYRSKSCPQFVTAADAADILRTSKRTIWRLARIGKIRRLKIGYRSIRFAIEDSANITSVDDDSRQQAHFTKKLGHMETNR